MSLIRKLAGETAIYGISSIVGRTLNYLLVPLYTAVFAENQYGIVTQLYAYAAFLNIVYTYGMETAFFRYGSQGELLKTFRQAAALLFLTSSMFTILIVANAPALARYAGQPDQVLLIYLLAGILYVDAIAAIPFARLRLENKALTFAIAKLGAIVVTIGLNLIFLLIPYLISKGMLTDLQPLVNRYYQEEFGVGYVFLANLMGNLLIIVVLWRYFKQFKLSISWSFIKPMLAYGLPIFLMGLAGIANEQADKILIPELLPTDFYAGKSSMAALGIYGASFKLSIFMLLAIQAFRYAGEPFFFNQATNREAPELFARVMYYFVVTCCIILVAVSLNLDLLGSLFLRQPSYREALYLVPILLVGKLFFGMYVNLSVWFKLKDRTMVGTYITLIGAFVTILFNVLLIPVIGYTGSAIASVLCYGSMTLICYYWGRSVMPIPYPWAKILVYILASVAIIYLTPWLFRAEGVFYTYLNMVVTLCFIGVVYLLEKKNLYPKAR